jgi:hypothetical protein
MERPDNVRLRGLPCRWPGQRPSLQQGLELGWQTVPAPVALPTLLRSSYLDQLHGGLARCSRACLPSWVTWSLCRMTQEGGPVHSAGRTVDHQRVPCYLECHAGKSG